MRNCDKKFHFNLKKFREIHSNIKLKNASFSYEQFKNYNDLLEYFTMPLDCHLRTATGELFQFCSNSEQKLDWNSSELLISYSELVHEKCSVFLIKIVANCCRMISRNGQFSNFLYLIGIFRKPSTYL